MLQSMASHETAEALRSAHTTPVASSRGSSPGHSPAVSRGSSCGPDHRGISPGPVEPGKRHPHPPPPRPAETTPLLPGRLAEDQQIVLDILASNTTAVGFKRHIATAQEIGTASLVLPLLGVQIFAMSVYWLLDCKNWVGHITVLEGWVQLTLAGAAATSCFTTVFSVLEVHYLMLVGGIHINDDDDEADRLQNEIAVAYNSFDSLRLAARNALWSSVAFLIIASFLRTCQAGGQDMDEIIFKSIVGIILISSIGMMVFTVGEFRNAYVPVVVKFG